MKDIEVIHNVIFDSIYKDKVRLEIELSKVSDKRLVLGLLYDLYGKEGYEADKKIVIDTITLFADKSDIDSNELFECNKYFIEEINEFRKTRANGPSMSVLNKALLLVKILKDNCKEGSEVDPEKVDKFVEEIKNSTPKEIEYFKSVLVDIESYETIVSIDNILKS